MSFTRPDGTIRTGKVVTVGIAVILGLALIFTGIRLFTGWLDKGADIIGPDNVSQQYDRVITEHESLIAAAANACAAEGSQSGATIVEGPELAYAATYRKIAVTYNARQADIFKAGLVGPPGYPESVPLVTDDWCGLADQIRASR